MILRERRYPILITGVADGDTFSGIQHLGDGLMRPVTVRLAAVNAYELKAPGGPEALKAVLELLPVGSWATLTCRPVSGRPEREDKREKYGRLLAHVTTETGVDVGQRLIDLKLAIPALPSIWEGIDE